MVFGARIRSRRQQRVVPAQAVLRNSQAGTVMFTPPPENEELPPYSPPALAPIANASGATEPTDLPPAYRPPTPARSSPSQPPPPPPPPKATFSRFEERDHLQRIFARHPWRRIWGPQPTSFVGALNKAALLGHQQLLGALFDLGVEVTGNRHVAIQTTTPMHEALRGPKPWLALTFLSRLHDVGGDAGELLESRDAGGCTPLHVAAEAGETAIARSLLFHGAAVNAEDRIGRTPLHMAARYRRAETVDMLLEAGANPAQVNGKLWWGVEDDAKRADLLGSYSLISRALRDAEERRKEALGRWVDVGSQPPEYVAGGDVDTGPTATATHTARLPPPPLLPANTSSTCPDPLPASGTSLSAPMPRVYPGSLHSRPRSDLTAPQLAAIYGINEVEAARRVLERRTLAQASSSRRPAQSLLLTPEYAIWRDACETAQAESRAQKARNRQEMGMPLDFY